MSDLLFFFSQKNLKSSLCSHGVEFEAKLELIYKILIIGIISILLERDHFHVVSKVTKKTLIY
jgi:hypothetical protein